MHVQLSDRVCSQAFQWVALFVLLTEACLLSATLTLYIGNWALLSPALADASLTLTCSHCNLETDLQCYMLCSMKCLFNTEACAGSLKHLRMRICPAAACQAGITWPAKNLQHTALPCTLGQHNRRSLLVAL